MQPLLIVSTSVVGGFVRGIPAAQQVHTPQTTLVTARVLWARWSNST